MSLLHKKAAVRRVSLVQPQDSDLWRVHVPTRGKVTVAVESLNHSDLALEVVDAVTGERLRQDLENSWLRVSRFCAVGPSHIDIRIANHGRRPTGYELAVTC